MLPKIDFSDRIQLDPDRKNTFQNILQRMFPDYKRVVVESELVSDSFSGSWVFLVHLVSRDNRPNLPVVVKIASTSLIHKERLAYRDHIRGKWSKTAEIRGEPVSAPDGTLSGLYYYLEGYGIVPVESLRSYCQDKTTTVEDIQAVLQRFAEFYVQDVLLCTDRALKHRLRASYDQVLPVNLLIKPASPPPDVEPTVVTPQDLPAVPLKPGSYVRLEDFIVTEVNPQEHTVTLSLPCSTDRLPDDSYRVRLEFESEKAMLAYEMGQLIPAIEGKVSETRNSQWQKQMEKLMAGQAFDLDSKTVCLDGMPLPNPFVALRDILGQFPDIKVGYIHGDLNLGNILVDRDVRDVCLIDFAEARWDHVLHDFLRLETEVVTKLVAPALAEAGLPVETICRFYEQLHCATFHSPPSAAARSPHPALDKPFAILQIVRELARDYGLFDRKKYDEYYNCLALYLLGALKFSNLDKKDGDPKPWPKQVAFWGAATVQQLSQEPPDCPKAKDIFYMFEQKSGALRRHIRVQEFQSLVNERTKVFIGRQFVFQTVDDLLADPQFPSGYIVIHGEPGIGKTALVAQLVKQQEYVHHFNIAAQNIRSARDFLANVCAQLIVRYELPYRLLPQEATKDSGFLSQLLTESVVKAEEQPVVVLVDALDEAEDYNLLPHANRLLLPPALPEGVFFVITTREQADYRLFVDHREDIYLRDNDPSNLEDVRQYIQDYLQTHPAQMAARVAEWGITEDEFVTVMTEKSQGNFMYLVYVLRDIRDGKLTAANIDDIRQLPQGLRGYYQRHWRSMRAQDETRFEKYYEPVVCYLATAREPVGMEQLVEWTKLRPRYIKEVINEWREFLNVDEGVEGEPRYHVYHTSFQDFLKEEVGLARYHDGIAQNALDKIPGF